MKKLILLFLIINCQLFIVNCAFGTAYTWTGTTSTAWNTSTNWTPSGVPTTSDNVTINQASGNMPVLDTVRTITNLTLSRGTLDLGGYTLTATGTISASGSSATSRAINNGVFIGTGASISLSRVTFGAKLDLTSVSPTVELSVLNNVCKLTKTGSGSAASYGGNKFADSLFITHSGSGPFYVGSGVSDTCNAPIVLKTTSTGYIYMAYGSNAHRYNGNLNIDITGGGGVSFGNEGGSKRASLASGKDLTVTNLSSGTLAMYGLSMDGSGTVSISGSSTSSILFGSTNVVVNRKIIASAGIVSLNGGTYNAPLNFTVQGAAQCSWYGVTR